MHDFNGVWIKVTLWQKYDTRLPIFWRPVRQSQNLNITNIKSAVKKMSLHDPKRYRSPNSRITITLHAHQAIYAQQKNYATFACCLHYLRTFEIRTNFRWQGAAHTSNSESSVTINRLQPKPELTVVNSPYIKLHENQFSSSTALRSKRTKEGVKLKSGFKNSFCSAC
jgi:hypothetical protein